jgi:adenine C2-methylase RlmN of 23S rRNA A2503 and tRNA A37
VQCDAFRSVLKDEFNMPCTIRQEKGSDIAGACGQLAIDHKNSNVKTVLDIEEVASRLLAV